MIGYYDLILGLVPASLLGVTGGLYGIGVDLAIAVPLAAVAAAAVIAHGLFVDPPVEEQPAPEPAGVAAD